MTGPADSLQDFEDMLALLAKHGARYLIIGGLAFIFHAKPRFTKDMDLWVDPDAENQERANRALAEFGSPTMLSPDSPDEIIQIGIAPDRIDILKTVGALPFVEAWERRVTDAFGGVSANWISLEDLLTIKESIQHPRHQEDARVLREVMRLREE